MFNWKAAVVVISLEWLPTLAFESHVVVWKSSYVLPSDSQNAIKSWTGMDLKIFNDSQCQEMANRHYCYGYNRSDIMNIMRADLCRYMALYENGGIYSDLDVTLKIPFSGNCKGLCVGREYSDKNTIANYCFMAPKFDSCLLKAIRYCCKNLATVKMDFTKDPHLIHHSCGPDAFTKAVSGCARHVWPHNQFSRHVHHAVASSSWHNYPSWIEERKNRAGWRDKYQY